VDRLGLAARTLPVHPHVLRHTAAAFASRSASFRELASATISAALRFVVALLAGAKLYALHLVEILPNSCRSSWVIAVSLKLLRTLRALVRKRTEFGLEFRIR
jgi:hypothetical protein